MNPDPPKPHESGPGGRGPGHPGAPARGRCPECGGAALRGPDNPHRPFCSRRCRLLDLGEWFDEFGTRDEDDEARD